MRRFSVLSGELTRGFLDHIPAVRVSNEYLPSFYHRNPRLGVFQESFSMSSFCTFGRKHALRSFSSISLESTPAVASSDAAPEPTLEEKVKELEKEYKAALDFYRKKDDAVTNLETELKNAKEEEKAEIKKRLAEARKQEESARTVMETALKDKERAGAALDEAKKKVNEAIIISDTSSAGAATLQPFKNAVNNRKAVQSNGKMLDELVAGLKDQVFAFLDGHSGIGKTQSAFAMANVVRVALIYDFQDVNKATARFSHALHEALMRDMIIYEIGNQSISTSVLRGRLQQKKSWILGVVDCLLSATKDMDTFAAADFVASGEKIVVEPLTLQEFQAKNHTGRVLVLDEVPVLHSEEGKGQWSKYEFRTLRDTLRIGGLKVLLMGTDATVSNLVDSGAGSRDDPHSWAVVAHSLSAYSPTEGENALINSLPTSVQLLIRSTNPLFAKVSLAAVGENPDLVSDEIALIRAICMRLWTDIAVRKFPTRKGWLHGQVALHLNSCQPNSIANQTISGHFAHLVNPVWSNWFYSVKEIEHRLTLKSVSEEEKQTLSSELEKLNSVSFKETDPFLLHATGNGVYFKERIRWYPHCKLPGAEKDPLLYLAFGGMPGYSPYWQGGTNMIESPTAAQAFVNLHKSKEHNISENSNALCYDGSELEARSVVAMQRASREKELGEGMGVVEWIRRICCEMRLKETRQDCQWTDESTALLESLSALESISIPWLCGAGTEWPDVLLKLTNKNRPILGYIERSANMEKRDAIVKTKNGQLVCTESKNHKNHLNASDVNEIITRFKGMSAPLMLVFCNKISEGLFARSAPDIPVLSIDASADKTLECKLVGKMPTAQSKKIMILIECENPEAKPSSGLLMWISRMLRSSTEASQ